MLRFGGITADENVAWTDSQTPRPAWATSTIGPTQLNELGTLARRSGWQVLLTVGMAHYEPTVAAREVAAAHRALGPYLAAVEIGNEPNSYGSHGFRELPWIAQGYEEQASAYREAIDALTPDVPIAGPDVSGSGAFSEWGEEEALAQSPVAVDRPSLSAWLRADAATVDRSAVELSGRGAAALSLASYMAVSELRDIPLRIDEANTVSCGGVAGISDTFASALWATGYITQAMAAGTAGINLQGNPTNCVGYTPICAPNPTALAQGELRAQPEWYALLLTHTLIGDRPLPTTISAEGAPNIVAAGFSGPGHSLKVVLCNNEPEGTSPLSVQLQVGSGMGAAQIQRLTDSSPSATSGVLLAGHAVSTNGSWRAPLRAESVASTSGTVTVELPPGSAALVTVAPPKPTSKSHSQNRHKRKSTATSKRQVCVSMLFRSVHAPTGLAAHVRPGTAPHAALSSRICVWNTMRTLFRDTRAAGSDNHVSQSGQGPNLQPSPDSGRDETQHERLDRNLEEMTGELRVVVTGVQVLFAFLLIVPFDTGFAHVGAYERAIYS